MTVAGHGFEHLACEIPHLRTAFVWLRHRVFKQIVYVVPMALNFIGDKFKFSLQSLPLTRTVHHPCIENFFRLETRESAAVLKNQHLDCLESFILNDACASISWNRNFS